MNDTVIKDRTLAIIFVAIIFILSCTLAVTLFYTLLGGQLPWSKISASPNLDPVWLRIQNNNKMIVGVSADYPPFSYVGDDFSVQGYDLALIQEIGNRLGVPIEIHNMAFDGLIPALMLNQIDVAIAAISITPERDSLVDFSNVYYVGEDALLARRDSNLQIGNIQDLANYQIGVQTGSVYQSWLEDTLVRPGQMRSQYLHSFQTTDMALQALVSDNPEIEAYLLDLQPAEAATQSQPVKIIAKGYNPQQYAIAIPQGATTFQAQINQSLNQLVNDGTLAMLAYHYLNVTSTFPLPTPGPTQIPATRTACLDGMKFIQDHNFADFNMTQLTAVQPDELIQKSWRILNTGTCIWDSTYTLAYIGSVPENSPVGGNPVAIQGQVPPGQTYDISADLYSPSLSGSFQSFWSLRNGAGQFFGDRLWAGFQVVSQTQPIPGPQSPTITRFLTDRIQITPGECVNLDWEISRGGLTFSRIFRNGSLLILDLPSRGSYQDCPPGEGQVEYRLSLDSSSYGTAGASQFINIYQIDQPLPAPIPTSEQPLAIFFFNSDSTVIVAGQCINLSWSFSGTNLTAANITRNGQAIASEIKSDGSFQDCPQQTGQFEYLLFISSEFLGTVQNSIFVTVRSGIP